MHKYRIFRYFSTENTGTAYDHVEVISVKKYQRIRDLREDADLYQRDLAKLLNCSQQTYSDYERGVVDIPTEVLIALADYYDTTTDYILGRTNQRIGIHGRKPQNQG